MKSAATTTRTFRSFLLMSQLQAQEIGLRIKQKRKERGITQDELAALTSFSARSLQDYENGVTIPYRHFTELGRLLNTPSEWFMYGDEREVSQPSQLEAVPQTVEALARQSLQNQEDAQEILSGLASALDDLAGAVRANGAKVDRLLELAETRKTNGPQRTRRG